MLNQSSMQAALTHVSFYAFRRLGSRDELEALRSEVRELGRAHALTGTVLLASEGVNAMISGEAAAIRAFLDWARARWNLGDHDFRESQVGAHSFKRFLVKIKREIISVGDPDLKPDERTARRLAPAELKAWLDEGKPVTLLDTRNTYESNIGTFAGARTLELDHSRDFARLAEEILPELRGRPVVTFCTGGIRCEKGSALLLKLGLEESDLYQLDGGILRYFEEMGGAHFRGSCFVFDGREAVDAALRPTARAEDDTVKFGRHQRKR